MLDERFNEQSTGSCKIGIKGISATVQRPSIVRFVVTKDSKSYMSQEFSLDPQSTSYTVNQTFEFPLYFIRDTASGAILQQRVV